MDNTYLDATSAWCHSSSETTDEDFRVAGLPHIKDAAGQRPVARALTRSQWTALRYRTRFSVCSQGHYAADFPPASSPVGGYASVHQIAASHVCAVLSMPAAASCGKAWPNSAAFGPIVNWDRACAR